MALCYGWLKRFSHDADGNFVTLRTLALRNEQTMQHADSRIAEDPTRNGHANQATDWFQRGKCR